MNETERVAAGEVIRQARMARFKSVDRARIAADLSRGAWENLESGKPVRAITLASAIKALGLTEAELWARMDALSVGGATQDAPGKERDYVSAPGATIEAGITNEDLLREILRSRADSDQIRAGMDELGRQVAALRQDHDSLSRRVEKLDQ